MDLQEPVVIVFYTLLSSGYLDLIIENNLKPFDIVPIVPIIIGAGGSISNWNGESVYTDGNIIASCNDTVHTQILEVVNSVCECKTQAEKYSRS